MMEKDQLDLLQSWDFTEESLPWEEPIPTVQSSCCSEVDSSASLEDVCLSGIDYGVYAGGLLGPQFDLYALSQQLDSASSSSSEDGYSSVLDTNYASDSSSASDAWWNKPPLKKKVAPAPVLKNKNKNYSAPGAIKVGRAKHSRKKKAFAKESPPDTARRTRQSPASGTPAVPPPTPKLPSGLSPKLWVMRVRSEPCNFKNCRFNTLPGKKSQRTHYHPLCQHEHKTGKNAGLKFACSQLDKARKHQKLHPEFPVEENF